MTIVSKSEDAIERRVFYDILFAAENPLGDLQFLLHMAVDEKAIPYGSFLHMYALTEEIDRLLGNLVEAYPVTDR
jgi:hypothetical protein